MNLKTFQELSLIEPLRKSLQEQAYVTPTPIQAQAIPPALAGRDVLGCAQTGTGKTAAFALPILQRLGEHQQRAVPRQPRALILAPTRELAIQIGDSFRVYGKHLRLRYALVYGGVGQASQVQSLKQGVHVLVATPGRLLDLMDQGYVDLAQLDVFVLDEADRMLDMGFMPSLKRIIAALPRERQSLFFSATLPPNIVELAEELLTDPVSVNVTPKSSSVSRINQQVLFLARSEKQEVLRQLLSLDEVQRAIVFTRTKRGANMVADRLNRNRIPAAAIHGNKSQNARQRALESFRDQSVRVLVATDVAARGIDIDGITHVVNFDMPVEPESYVHRIGRTGRAGATGVALSFCTNDEFEELLAIERLIARPLAAPQDRPAGLDQMARQSAGRPAAAAKTAAGSGQRRPRGTARPAARQRVTAAPGGRSGRPGGTSSAGAPNTPQAPGRSRGRRTGNR